MLEVVTRMLCIVLRPIRFDSILDLLKLRLLGGRSRSRHKNYKLNYPTHYIPFQFI